MLTIVRIMSFSVLATASMFLPVPRSEIPHSLAKLLQNFAISKVEFSAPTAVI